MNKTIGILGGMGPEATIYLFRLIVKLTGANKDQEHIPIIVWNNPHIPDRTAAILGQGPSSLPFLIEGAVFLEKAGANLILMPCVTAHYYYKEIIKNIATPFLNLLEETANYLHQELRRVRKVGLLATDGTIQSGLFQELFEKSGVDVVIPDPGKQNLVMKALYQKDGIKAGFKDHPREMILHVLHHLLEKNVEAVIAGCTEIPLVLNQFDMPVLFLDPLRILAEKSIREAGYELKENEDPRLA